ncbi:MAG: LamG-like jellyroll fold domain-containing protein [Candidatus Paceibacterota bacterium]
MNRRGFTLIELLVVIAIVGILSSVIYSNITGIRDRARITAGIRFDSSTLHSIGDQLVGEWTFDSPNLPLIDTSGFGNTGTCTACPTYATTSGYNNKGTYDLNGTSHYIEISTSLIIPTGDFTYTAWVKLDTNNDEVIFMAAGGGNEFLFSISTLVGIVYTNDILRLTGKTVIPTGTWAHMAATRAGSVMKLYVNGKEDGTGTDGGVLNFSTCPLLIGVDVDTGCVGSLGNYFNGYVDDLRVYSSALSGSDIQKLYVEGLPLHEVAAK